jgi:hypothetical protein
MTNCSLKETDDLVLTGSMWRHTVINSDLLASGIQISGSTSCNKYLAISKSHLVSREGFGYMGLDSVSL